MGTHRKIDYFYGAFNPTRHSGQQRFSLREESVIASACMCQEVGFVVVTGQATSQELRSGASERHPRRARNRHRTLQEFNGMVPAQGGRQGQQTEKYGLQQPNTTFERSETALNPTPSHDIGSAALVGAGAVWAKLLEAKQHPPCSSPPCKEVSPPCFSPIMRILLGFSRYL